MIFLFCFVSTAASTGFVIFSSGVNPHRLLHNRWASSLSGLALRFSPDIRHLLRYPSRRLDVSRPDCQTFGRNSVRAQDVTPSVHTEKSRDLPQPLKVNVGILPQVDSIFLTDPFLFIDRLSYPTPLSPNASHSTNWQRSRLPKNLGSISERRKIFLVAAQLVNKFPTLCGNLRSFTLLHSWRHDSLLFILILSSHFLRGGGVRNWQKR
jgi:hypothetical protein